MQKFQGFVRVLEGLVTFRGCYLNSNFILWTLVTLLRTLPHVVDTSVRRMIATLSLYTQHSQTTDKQTNKQLNKFRYRIRLLAYYSTAAGSNSAQADSRSDAVINRGQLPCAWERDVRTSHASSIARCRIIRGVRRTRGSGLPSVIVAGVVGPPLVTAEADKFLKIQSPA